MSFQDYTTQKAIYERTDFARQFSSAHAKIHLSGIERDYITRFFTDRDAPLLEGGCGSGRMTFAMEELGHRNITAFDFSRTLAADAQEQARRRGSAIKFLEADACDLATLAGDSFQYVIYGAQMVSIIAMPQRLRALREAKRVLRPGGVFVFSVLNRRVSLERRMRLKLFALRDFFSEGAFRGAELPYMRVGSRVNWQGWVAGKPTATWYTAAEIQELVTCLGFKVLHCTDTTRIDSNKPCFAIQVACTKQA